MRTCSAVTQALAARDLLSSAQHVTSSYVPGERNPSQIPPPLPGCCRQKSVHDMQTVCGAGRFAFYSIGNPGKRWRVGGDLNLIVPCWQQDASIYDLYDSYHGIWGIMGDLILM